MRESAIVTTVIVFGIVAWCVLVAASPASSTEIHEQLPNLARNLSSGLFLVGGVLELARWRVTADPRAALVSVALLGIGTALPAVVTIGPLLYEPDAVAQSAPSTRALFLLPAVALLVRGTRTAAHETGQPIPPRFAAKLGVACGLCLVALLVSRQLLDPGQASAGWTLIAVVSAAGWLVVARRARRIGWTGPQTGSRLGFGFALLALTELARACALLGASTAVGLAPGLQLAAAAVIARATASSLRQVSRADTARAADLARAVTRLKRNLDALEAAQRERLHDARSVVVGVRGASELLSSHRGAIEPSRVCALMAAELDRLQTVLDLRAQEPIGEFDLGDTLAAVILVRQLDGAAITSELADLRVVGRARTTATVLDNLLSNAAVHAPGARVGVRGERCGTQVRVVVEDDGPGIPPDEREAVLRRGVRGSRATAAGDGLGLYTCATSMRAQGGALQLTARPGGGTRVSFTLPSAVAARANALAS